MRINNDLLARAALNPSLKGNKKETDMGISQMDKSFVQATCPMCSERDNDDMIQCCTCRSWLHFACTKLPAYQILTFSKTQRKFTCENCTEEREDNLQLKCFNSQVYKPIVENFDEDIKLMQHEIQTLKVLKDKHTEHQKM